MEEKHMEVVMKVDGNDIPYSLKSDGLTAFEILSLLKASKEWHPRIMIPGTNKKELRITVNDSGMRFEVEGLSKYEVDVLIDIVYLQQLRNLLSSGFDMDGYEILSEKKL